MIPGLGFWAAPVSVSTAWPTANRTWLFDPDSADHRVLTGDGFVTELAEVGGDPNRYLYQGSSSWYAALVTAHGRGMLDFPAVADNTGYDGTVEVLNDLSALRGPATISLVYKPPAALPSANIPLFGAINWEADEPANQILLQPNGNILVHRVTDGGLSYPYTAAKPGAAVWDTNAAYLITVVYASGGAVQVYRDDTAWAVTAPNGVAPAATITASNLALGWHFPLSGIGFAVGRFGALMRYGTAYTAGEVASLSAIKAARYP